MSIALCSFYTEIAVGPTPLILFSHYGSKETTYLLENSPPCPLQTLILKCSAGLRTQERALRRFPAHIDQAKQNELMTNSMGLHFPGRKRAWGKVTCCFTESAQTVLLTRLTLQGAGEIVLSAHSPPPWSSRTYSLRTEAFRVLP